MGSVKLALAAKVPRSESDWSVRLGGVGAAATSTSSASLLLVRPIGEIDADGRKVFAARLLRLTEICADALRPMRPRSAVCGKRRRECGEREGAVAAQGDVRNQRLKHWATRMLVDAL